MPAKVAEIFTEISVDISKMTSGMDRARSAVGQGAAAIQEKLDAIRKVSEFEIKVKNLEGVTASQKALNGIIDKIASLRKEMAALGTMKIGILQSQGLSEGVIKAFGVKAGVPTLMGKEVAQADDLRAIDDRRATIVKEVATLTGMQAAAEGKLTAEKERQTRAMATQAILAQARIEDTGRAARMIAAATDGMPAAPAIGQGRGSGLMGSLMMQASFGMQDFVTVMGMGGGLRMAMAGMSNNLSQMVAILGMMGTIGPVAASIGSLGVALGAAVIPMLVGTTKKAEETRKAIDDLSESFRSAAANRELFSRIRTAGDASTVSSSKAAQEQEIAERKKMEEAQAKIEDLVKAREAAGISKQGAVMQTFALQGMQPGKGFFNLNEAAAFQKFANENFGADISAADRQALSNAIQGSKDAQGRPLNTKLSGGRQARVENGQLQILELPTAQRLKDIDEEILKLGKEIGDEEGKSAEAQRRIVALKERRKELADSELKSLRQHLDVSEKIEALRKKDPLNRDLEGAAAFEDKIQKIKDKAREDRADIMRNMEPGAERADELKRVGDKQKRDLLDANRKEQDRLADERKKKFDENKRLEDHTKDFQRGIDRDNMTNRQRDIEAIQHELEQRKKEIDENPMLAGGPARDAAMAGAAQAAESKLNALRFKGSGEKLTAVGLADAMQKAVFGDDLKKNTADTAKNTAQMVQDLQEVIKTMKAGARAGA